MTTCFRCGRELEFKWIDGINRPIGCVCGEGRHSSIQEPDGALVIESENCRIRRFPCPTCRNDIYFVRHNGGCVWLEDIGYPWPRHECGFAPVAPFWLLNRTRTLGAKVGFLSKSEQAAGYRFEIVYIKTGVFVRSGVVREVVVSSGRGERKIAPGINSESICVGKLMVLDVVDCSLYRFE